MEATGTAEDSSGAPMNASATDRNICGCWTGECRVVGDIDGTGAFKAERLKHAFMVVDGQWVVATEVGKLVEDIDRQIPFVGIGWFRR
jgi:hypothetical protein